MENSIKLELKQTTVENLRAFSDMLNRDINTILEEALEQYFENEQQKLMANNEEDDNAMTNLDYDEFWDGLDLG